jgi:hypothetical protein
MAIGYLKPTSAYEEQTCLGVGPLRWMYFRLFANQ